MGHKKANIKIKRIDDMRLKDKFLGRLIEDKKYIKSWMVSWDYQNERIQNVKYPDEYPSTFDTYNGIEDIQKWINWISKSEFKDDLNENDIDSLLYLSYFFDNDILNLDRIKYMNTIGRYNSEDYVYQSEHNKGNRILDIGPGYGRQANLLSQLIDNLVYVGIEGILQSYCMQYLYYSNTSLPVNEYLLNDNIEIDKMGIYHLPTWRCDLLPRNYFDKILCVQVLQEINEELVRYFLNVFKDVIKKDGILYIRDHGKGWKYSSHSLDIDKILPEYGFKLDYKHDLEDRTQVHGIHRIWRKL